MIYILYGEFYGSYGHVIANLAIQWQEEVLRLQET